MTGGSAWDEKRLAGFRLACTLADGGGEIPEMEVEFRRAEDAYADRLAEAHGTRLGTPTCFVRMSGGMK